MTGASSTIPSYVPLNTIPASTSYNHDLDHQKLENILAYHDKIMTYSASLSNTSISITDAISSGSLVFSNSPSFGTLNILNSGSVDGSVIYTTACVTNNNFYAASIA